MLKTLDPGDVALRQEIIEACRLMNRNGLNQGTSGNISVRRNNGILITPTSMPYDDLVPSDIVSMNFEGRTEGSRVPSTEWRFHLDIMRAKPDVNAIVHAHPTFCTTIAIMEKSIPPLHYMIAVAGGHDIRCAPYATYGTKELSDHALDALDDRHACLLAHHGMISTGASLGRAMWLAVEVEALARQYHGCLQLGEVPLLPIEEIDRVRAKIAEGYGHTEG